MTLIVCLFISFQNNEMFLNLLQQRNVAVLDGFVVNITIVVVCLSLLTMTNLNQVFEVLVLLVTITLNV